MTDIHFSASSPSLSDADTERFLRHIIATEPANAADAYADLGALCARQQRILDAEFCYRQVLALDPQAAHVHSNLGVLLAASKRDDEAEDCYRQALQIDKRNAATHLNLGVLLAKRGRLREARLHFRLALALTPQNAAAHVNMGLLLQDLALNEERERGKNSNVKHGAWYEAVAERRMRQAIALNPALAEAYSNLANLLAKQSRFAEAEQCYRQSLGLEPNSSVAHSNFGVMLARQQRGDEAEQHFRDAIALQPANAQAHVNLAFLLLAQGRLAEGWLHHEARYVPSLPQADVGLPSLPFPQWNGEPLAGKSLLIWPEQGFGDAIQFCRYLPLLKQQGAAHITVICRAPLKPLLATLEGVNEVRTTHDIDEIKHDFDYWAFLLSLPLHCGTDLHNIPAPIPYLSALAERVAHWRSRLPEQGVHRLRVGLAWRGNSYHANDRNRSLPGLATLRRLWSVSNVAFISLQLGAEYDEALATAPVRHLGSEIHDFGDTAAIIAQLDLLISVDTANAHVAGALGIPCWMLLPADQTDWRWMANRTDTPWYPQMRLFRQQTSGDWDAVMDQVAHALDTLTQEAAKR